MRFGKQHRYCPNCGRHLYDENVSMQGVQCLMCDAACRDAWELKYTRSILGKSAEESPSSEFSDGGTHCD